MIPSILALEEGYCLVAEVSDISPSSIEIGEEFTIGIHIENCGEKLPTEIYYEIINPPEKLIIKEPLITHIPQIRYANSERFLVYHVKVSDDAISGEYVLKTRLSYGGYNLSIDKDYSITIDVIGSEAELSVASVKTKPVLPYEGDLVDLTLRIENTGEGTAKSVSVYIDHPFQGLKQSFIGSLDSDEDGPAVITFIADKSGEFEFPLIISYQDDFGKNEVKTMISFSVLEKKTNLFVILFGIIIIIIIGVFVFYSFKTKKEKDRVIQQLLKGNGNGKNKLKRK